jgi:hypothetical protein
VLCGQEAPGAPRRLKLCDFGYSKLLAASPETAVVSPVMTVLFVHMQPDTLTHAASNHISIRVFFLADVAG